MTGRGGDKANRGLVGRADPNNRRRTWRLVCLTVSCSTIAMVLWAAPGALRATAALPATDGARHSQKPGASSAQSAQPRHTSSSGGTASTSPQSYASSVLAGSPLVYYRLDETSGATAADSSGNGNNGTYTSSGVTYGASGALLNDSNTAVGLAGSAEISDTSLPVSAGQAYTMEFWFQVSSSQYSSGTLDLGASPGGTLQLTNGGTTLMTEWVPDHNNKPAFGLPYAVNDGTWHLFDVEYDAPFGSGCTVLLDGSVVGSESGSNTCGVSNGPGLIIGAFGDGNPTAGAFDEVAVYPTLLPGTRVAAHWTIGASHLNQGTLCPPTPSSAYASRVLTDAPAVYLRLNELASDAAGRVAFDSSGHCTTTNPTNGTYPPNGVSSTAGALAGDSDTAISFASSTSSLIRDTSASLPGPGQAFTTEFWFKVSPSQYSSGTLDLGASPGGTLQLTNGGSTLLTEWVPDHNNRPVFGLPYAVNDSKWHLFDIEYDASFGNGCTVLLDGSVVGSESGSNTCGVNNGPGLIIGAFGDGNPTAGAFDDVAVYPTLLSSTSIQDSFCIASGCPPIGGAYAGPQTYGGGNFCLPCLVSHLLHSLFGAPVDTATGNMSDQAVDLSITGRGYPLAFTRTYNSQAARSATGMGPLGYGWNSDYEMSLSESSGTVTITQENGAQVTFTQSGSSWVPSAPRFIATLTNNSDGSWTFVRQARDTFQFNSAGQLTAETDLNGYTSTFAFAGGLLSTVTDSSGRSLSFTWETVNGSSVIHNVTDTNVTPNRITTFQYNDGNGNLTDVIDVNGGHWHYAYDASHQLVSLEDPNCVAAILAKPTACDNGEGIITQYDSEGRAISQTDQLGRTTTFDYTSIANATKVRDAKHNVEVDYYSNGLETAVTKGYGTPQAATWQYAYDPATLARISTTDPNGHSTVTVVDGSGNPVTVTDALGRQTVNTFNSFNEILTSEDPNNVSTTSTYDSRGNLKSTSRPLLDHKGQTVATQLTSYCYYSDTTCGASAGPVGDLYSMTDPDGNVWRYTYDAFGDRVTVTDPRGDVATTCYNAIGWTLASYTPKAGAITCGSQPPSSPYESQYSYVQANGQVDQFGDVQTVTDPLLHVTTSRYDADRNRTSETDAVGETTTFVYDLANQLTETKRPGGTVLKNTYYADGTVKDEKDGNGNAIVAYTYDSQRRTATAADALGHVTTFGYDLAGNDTSKIDPNGSCTAPISGCTTMTYDDANQLTGISYSDTPSANVSNIRYDGDGQRLRFTDSTGTSVWTYDSLRRLTSDRNGAGASVGFDYLTPNRQYDLKVQVGHIMYPNGAGTVTQTWDTVGRLSSVQDWNLRTVGFGYDANSNLDSETVPSTPAVTDSFGYDATDRMSSVSVSNGTSLFSATYTRNADGLVKTDSSVPASQGAYKYSELNQICYAGSTTSPGCTKPPSGSYPYTYDEADNLTTTENSSDTASSAQVFDAGDRLCWTAPAPAPAGAICTAVPTNATAYQYDTRDNRTAMVPPTGSATCYGYDQADRLTAITAGTGTNCTTPTQVASYGYNADGLRMSRSMASVTTQFSWDVSGAIALLLQETNPTTTANYIYGPGGLPIEQISGGVTSWLHHDQLGSTRLLTSSSGAAVAGYMYDPYGNVVTSSGIASTPLLFAGQYRDAESGFYYMRARYYDPPTAQFLSRDSLASLTKSAHGYANGDPQNRVDPLGLWGGSGCFIFCIGTDSDQGVQWGIGSPGFGASPFSSGPGLNATRKWEAGAALLCGGKDETSWAGTFYVSSCSFSAGFGLFGWTWSGTPVYHTLGDQPPALVMPNVEQPCNPNPPHLSAPGQANPPHLTAPGQAGG